MKKLFLSTFFCISLFSFQVFSQSNSRLNLGTPENLLNSIRNQRSSTPATYSLQLTTGAVAAITIENYSDQASGFSMNGIAKESANSLFILKGDRTSLYGYLVLHDSKKAYEISTNDGVVSLQEINIAAIYPDLYETEMKPSVEQGAAPVPFVAPAYSPMAKRQAVHIGPYNNEDVTKLQSRPGSKYVFYLNHSAVMSGTTPKNNRGKDEMFRVWQCTADQYSMYDLNITTDLAVYNAAKSADVLKTGNIKFVDEDGRSNACVACFGTTAAGTLYRNPLNNDYGYGIGMTCAHEIGHQMGMSHDGGSAQSDPEYFFGLPAVQWCPIMGNYWKGGNWNNQLFTWSKGEYNTATQKQDDLKIMNVNEKVPYMADDNVSGKKLKIGSAGTIGSTDNWGQIEKNTDTDEFTFEVGESGGKINLKIDPIEYLRQLDVAAKIVDASGTAVATSNLAVNRSAEFKDLSLKSGKYTLVIQGGAELTPQTGFSSYSSLGYYAMEGTLTGAIVTNIGAVAFENKVAVFPNPTADVLNISYGFNNQNTQVTLIDVTGQTVYQSNQQVESIDLSTFSKGIYFLRISQGQESCVKKISKL
jgi:hypothetical protein